MNPFALCRWLGSTLPGGYSTVIIRPSLPGRFGRSFDRRSFTLACCASSVPDMRHTNARIAFVNFIKISLSIGDAFNGSHVCRGGTSPLRVVPHQLCRFNKMCARYERKRKHKVPPSLRCAESPRDADAMDTLFLKPTWCSARANLHAAAIFSA